MTTTVYYMDPRIKSGEGDGTTWEDAVKTLAEGFALLDSDDELWVKAGMFPAEPTAALPAGASIYGGFDPDLTGTDGDKDERIPEYHKSIIYGYGTDQAFTFATPGDGFLIDGLHFLKCHSDDNGGALYISAHDSWTIQNCVFRECTADTSGGALYCGSGTVSVTIDGCTFGMCTSANNGGALYLGVNGTGVIKNNRITGCRADAVASMHGGGIYAYGATQYAWKITNCLIDHCYASGDGGGVYFGTGGSSNEAGFITNCNISYNVADGTGGGIYCPWGESYPDVATTCVIRSNYAPSSPQVYAYSTAVDYTNTTQSLGGGTGNINVAPDYRGYGAHPFEMVASNAGNDCLSSSTYSLSSDIRGRNWGDDPEAGSGSNYIDMGCYDYKGMDYYTDYLLMDYWMLMFEQSAGGDSSPYGPFTIYIILRLPEEPKSLQEFGREGTMMELECAGEIQIAETTSYLGETITGGVNSTWRTTTGTAIADPDWEEDFDTGKQGGTDTWYGELGQAQAHKMRYPESWPDMRPLYTVLRIKFTFSSTTETDEIHVYNYHFLPKHYYNSSYTVDPCWHDSATDKWGPDLPMSAAHVSHVIEGLYKMLEEAYSPFTVKICGSYAEGVIVV